MNTNSYKARGFDSVQYAATSHIRSGRVYATLDATPLGLGKIRTSIAYDYHQYSDRANFINSVAAAVEKLGLKTGLDMRFVTCGVADVAQGKCCVIVSVYSVGTKASQ